MSATIPTPNMGLNLPVVGDELGPQYGNDNNGAFFQVDSHNHSFGQGVQINPAGIDINTDLPFNGNNATLLNSTEYVNLVSPLPGVSPFLNTTYFSGGNFYVNDGAGNQIKITSSGTVNATSSGISSGTATASFVGGVLVVDSNVNTPANIQAGSILIGNNVSGSNFATLMAPSGLGANYSLTLPPTNSTGTTAFVTIDTSNNMGELSVIGQLTTANLSPTAGITGGQIAALTITDSNIAAGTITNDKLAPANIQVSSSSGTINTAATLPLSVLAVTITTSGLPVAISLQPVDSGPGGYLTASTTGSTFFVKWLRDGAAVPSQTQLFPVNSGDMRPPGQVNFVDYSVAGSAGSHTYDLQIYTLGGQTIGIVDCVIVAYEIA